MQDAMKERRPDTEDSVSDAEIPLLNTVEGAAKRWLVSRTTVFMAIQRGAIKTVKLGRCRRIHRDEILRVAREGLA